MLFQKQKQNTKVGGEERKLHIEKWVAQLFCYLYASLYIGLDPLLASPQVSQSSIRHISSKQLVPLEVTFYQKANTALKNVSGLHGHSDIGL